MKITKKKKYGFKKSIIPIGVLACVVAVGILLFLNGSSRQSSSSSINLNPPTKEEKQAGSSTKEQTVEKDQAEKTTKNENTTPSPPALLSVSITATNKTSSTMQIRVQIDSIIDSGSCDIILKNGSSSIHHTVDVAPLASTSTCKGFDIPLSELSSGIWNYTITATDSSTGRTGSVNGTFSL